MPTHVVKCTVNLTDTDEDVRKKKYGELCSMVYEHQRVRNHAIRTFVLRTALRETMDAEEKKSAPSYYQFWKQYQTPLKVLTKSQMYTAERDAEKKFASDFRECMRGERSYPVFKDTYLNVKGEIVFQKEDDYLVAPFGLKQQYVFVITNLHKNHSARNVIERCMAGEQGYKFGDSRLVRKDGSWHLLLSYSFPEPEQKPLDPALVCGVDMGWVIPAACALSEGYANARIGGRDEVHKLRKAITQFRTRRRSVAAGRHSIQKGHGKQRALKPMDHLAEKEARFRSNWNHLISRRVIEFALKCGAGTIHMEQLTQDVKKSKFLSEYWTYYQLQAMIRYKAKDAGIAVHLVDPAYTSQTCSACGHVDAESRQSQSFFSCTECGYEKNADVNAAVNIARRPPVEDEDDKKKQKNHSRRTKSASSPTTRRKGEKCRGKNRTSTREPSLTHA